MKKNNERRLFFDIETTGLSPEVSAITLIGCLDDHGLIKQWFNEDGFSQKQILTDFFAYCNSYDTLISFNGTTFDLPFLKAKAKEFQMNDPFSMIHHEDFYQKLRSYRHLIDTQRFRQKDLEQYVHFQRKDRLSGKKIIKTYQDFLKTNDPTCKEKILLHNEEDLKGLFKISSLQCYPSLKAGNFSVDQVKRSCDYLQVFLTLSDPFPVSATFTKKEISLKVENNFASLIVPIKNHMLRHYYPNPKDYFYLPKEDTILPKSMGSFVDHSSKTACDFDHCYLRFAPSDSFLSNMDELHTFSTHTIQYLFIKE